MFRLKVLIITFFIASAFCNDDGSEGREGWKRGKDKREKLKQCLQETKSLKDCCAYPNLLKNDDPECKHHLEGFEDKTEREQHRANACFTECMYKSRGLFTDGEFDKEKIRSQVGEKLVENNEDEFKDIAISSIDKCFAEIEAKQESWNKFKASRNNRSENAERHQRCSKLPLMFRFCTKAHIYRNCPESKWQNTDHCNELKANATSIEDCMGH